MTDNSETNPTYSKILNIIETSLKKEISVDEYITDYGADSIELSDISFKINRTFQLDITPSELSYDSQTIKEIIEYILSRIN
jgi:acyl carrier protein